jgi:hypothetical protein
MRDFEDKLTLVLSAQKIMAQGESIKGAAQRVGLPVSSLSRYLRAYEQEGMNALQSQRGNCGRKAAAGELPAEAAQALRKLSAKAACKADALKAFAGHPACPPSMKGIILRCLSLRKPFPPSLMRLARVTSEDIEIRKGKKHAQYVLPRRFRDDMEVLPDGTERLILAGDWWELDDMSSNQPFWFECDKAIGSRNGSGDRMLEKFGVALGRQGLYCRDLRGKWLGVELIGRPRDAYTAEDILRFLRRLMLEYGKPRRGLRIERGVWRSRAVAGHVIMDDAREEKIILGLRELGIQVVYCWSSRQKGGIEGGFHHLQTDATLFIDAPDIGRERGENEAATKKLLQAKAGTQHPKDLGFPHISAMAEEWRQILVARNMDTHTGRIAYGVPDVEWMKAVRAEPMQPVTRDELRGFLPWREERTLQLGYVQVTIDGDQWMFDTSDLPQGFGQGDKVYVAVDPTDPGLGAALYNANTSRNSPAGYNSGAFLGWAEQVGYAAQIGGQYRDMRKAPVKFKAFQAVYASTGIMGLQTQTTRDIRDGKGNNASIGDVGSGIGECGLRNADCEDSEATPARSNRKPETRNQKPETSSPTATRRNAFADPLLAMLEG